MPKQNESSNLDNIYKYGDAIDVLGSTTLCFIHTLRRYDSKAGKKTEECHHDSSKEECIRTFDTKFNRIGKQYSYYLAYAKQYIAFTIVSSHQRNYHIGAIVNELSIYPNHQ